MDKMDYLHQMFADAYQFSLERGYQALTLDILVVVGLKYFNFEKKDEIIKDLLEKIDQEQKAGLVELPPYLTNRLRKAIVDAKEKGYSINRFLMEIVRRSEGESWAAWAFRKNGVNPEILLDNEAKVGLSIEKVRKLTNIANAYSVLGAYTTELTAENVVKSLPDIIGRDEEIDEIISVLGKKNKNNVILVGEPGVGKTAIVEGLAKRIHMGNVPDYLKNARVYEIDIGKIIAGTKYRGELEQRLGSLVSAISYIADEEDVFPICFIDEIHMIVGAGAGGENQSIDIANLLKSAFRKGSLRVIGATTHKEFSKYFENDGALVRRFEKIVVEEPTLSDTKKIISALLPSYEEYHGVRYDSEVIDKTIEYAHRFVKHRMMPDKVIDIIDIVGSREKIFGNNDKNVTVDTVVREIARMANLPPERIMECDDDKNRNLENLETCLKKNVFGQDEAIRKIVDTILVSRAGMKINVEKPDAAFLFNGPTGVGKTEMAKQIAKCLDMNFIRVDMSEYSESNAVTKIIGAPPGYVGYDERGSHLVDKVAVYPNSVILFDEVEKAHPSVWALMLQLLDYGKLTSSNGKTVSFSETIVIFTGNVGSADAFKARIGFGNNEKDFVETQREKLKSTFPPEFLNRLTIVQFNKIGKDQCDKIIGKLLKNLNEMLKNRGIEVSLTEKAMDYIRDRGYSPEYGARNIEREFDKLKVGIARKILFSSEKESSSVGRSERARKITIDIDGDEVIIREKIDAAEEDDKVKQT